MQKKVFVHPYQEFPSTELNLMQDYIQQGMDDVVRDLLFDEGRFVRMLVTKTSALEVSVASGLFILAGAVYPKAAATTHSVSALIPSSNSRIVLVVVAGQTTQTDSQVRKFLLDATTRQTQPRPVATRISRAAVVDLIPGTAAATPVRPQVPAGSIVVASFSINASGIIGNPVMEAANVALSLEKAMDAVALLQAQDKKFAAQIATLSTALAGLQKDVNTRAKEVETKRILSDLLELRERLGVPDNSSFYGMDVFANEDESDEEFDGYTAKVEAGAMQHGDVEVATAISSLLNPVDPKVDKTEDGFIIPVSSTVAQIESDDTDESISISQYAVSTIVGKKMKMTRVWKYYGGKAGDASVAEELKKNPKIIVRDPETGAKSNIDLTGSSFSLKRYSKNSSYYELKVSTPYWSTDEETIETTGSRVAQTFLCSQEGWYKRIDVDFTDVGPSGDVRMTICQLTGAGTPNLDKIITEVTVARANLIVKGWTAFEFDPFFLERGERYAFVLTTTGAHFIGVSTSNEVANGTMLASTDGVTWATQIEKDITFRLIGCRFASTRVTVEIGSATLAGGMKALQAAFTGFVPEGTDLVLEARIGSSWRTVGEEDETVFASLPTLVPLRLIFVGTRYLMPGINIAKSRLIASRPRTTSVHVSTIRTLGAGTTTEVVVTQNSKDFVEANHDWTVAILHGAGYTTVAAHTAVETKLDRKDGVITRKWTFSGLPAISSYRIRTTLVSVSAADQHSVTQRLDYAA